MLLFWTDEEGEKRKKEENLFFFLKKQEKQQLYLSSKLLYSFGARRHLYKQQPDPKRFQVFVCFIGSVLGTREGCLLFPRHNGWNSSDPQTNELFAFFLLQGEKKQRVLCGEGMESHPRVIVWDLDGTLWSPEMYQLWGGGAPFAALNDGEHVVDRSGTKVELLADARAILNKLRGAEFEHIKLAIASTCDEPKWAAECLAKIRVENRALKDHFHDDVVEIYKASSKEVHLKAIAKKSSCELHDMIFFDNQVLAFL